MDNPRNGISLPALGKILQLQELAAEVPAPEAMEAIAIEANIAPTHNGVLLKLTNTKPNADGTLDSLTGALDVQQTRELCQHLLRICDACMQNTAMPQRTMLLVTPTQMWIQGQHLLIRDVGEGNFHVQWAIPPERVQAAKSKLILPASFRPT